MSTALSKPTPGAIDRTLVAVARASHRNPILVVLATRCVLGLNLLTSSRLEVRSPRRRRALPSRLSRKAHGLRNSWAWPSRVDLLGRPLLA